MVQLTDNFAIGVGASRDQRIKQFEAEEKTIGVLKEQYNIQMKQVAAFEASGNMEKANSVRNEAIDIENKILSVQQQQAAGVKAMRDGWISSLSSMNTGMGGFTEIVMTQNKGLMRMQKLRGSVTSNLTGSAARGAGYATTERFVAGAGDMADVVSVGREKAAYRSDPGLGDNTRAIEEIQRGRAKAMNLGNILQKQAGKVAGARGTGLGPQGMAQSAFIDRESNIPPISKGVPQVNVNLEFKVRTENLKKGLTDFAKNVVTPAIEGAVSEALGFSPQGTLS